MRVNDTLVWQDQFVSVFIDSDKCLVIFVNDKSNTKVLNFDSNFYCIEEDILAYEELLRDSLTYGGELEEDTYKEFLRDFIKDTEEQVKDTTQEIAWEYLEFYGIRKEMYL